MLAHADGTRENQTGSRASSVSQRRGVGESALPCMNDRPEVVALGRQQEMTNRSPRVTQLNALQEIANHGSAQPIPPVQKTSTNGVSPGTPVQMKPRAARVTWAITHLVRVTNNGQGQSLYGEGGDWESGEIAPEEGGQLSHDQPILVDDEAVFMSRRGPNQEDPERRGRDADADELKYEWLKVLELGSDGEAKAVPEDTYVRAETIRLVDAPRRTITLTEHRPDQESDVSEELGTFHEAWQTAASNRRRSVGHFAEEVPDDFTDAGEEITSGWNWDKFDEGENVAEDMRNPAERKRFKGVREQYVLSADYDAESAREPAAYMVLEERDDLEKENGGGRVMYLRWLIAHPERGGGATRLVQEAIKRFENSTATMLRVDSAFSAVGWYERFGFTKMPGQESVVKKGVGYADTRLFIAKK